MGLFDYLSPNEIRKKYKPRPDNVDEVMKKYPHLCGALIAESLGYLTPTSAGTALLRYIQNESFACEWYSDISRSRGAGLFDTEELIKINQEVIEDSFKNRKSLKGYMADYPKGLALVRRYNSEHKEPVFASWF